MEKGGESNLPISKNNLEVDNVIATETTAGRVKRVSAAGQEPGYADCVRPASRNCNTVGCQLFVDIPPSRPSLDLGNFCLRDIGRVLHKSLRGTSWSAFRVHDFTPKVSYIPRSIVTPTLAIAELLIRYSCYPVPLTWGLYTLLAAPGHTV